MGLGHDKLHGTEHTDGTDDIRDATAGQKGLATAAQITKLDGISPGADVTANNPPQAHSTSHENSGTDEINVDGLSGELADNQKQKALSFGFDETSTNSTSYSTHGKIIFPGTTKMGTPTGIFVNAYSNASSYDIRIRDVTNGNTIAELTGQTNTSYAMKDLGTLSNLPAGRAVFEVQLLISGGFGKDAYSSGGIIEW